MDRPTAAMGSDIQPERRIPLKPTSKYLPVKGGKQSQKHLLHKVLRRNKSLTGRVKKPHRYRPGLNPLLEELRNLIDTDLD